MLPLRLYAGSCRVQRLFGCVQLGVRHAGAVPLSVEPTRCLHTAGLLHTDTDADADADDNNATAPNAWLATGLDNSFGLLDALAEAGIASPSSTQVCTPALTHARAPRTTTCRCFESHTHICFLFVCVVLCDVGRRLPSPPSCPAKTRCSLRRRGRGRRWRTCCPSCSS